MDEAGFWLEKFNRSYAVVKKGQRGVAPGPYGHAEKWTIIAAICGDGRRWITMEKVPEGRSSKAARLRFQPLEIVKLWAK